MVELKETTLDSVIYERGWDTSLTFHKEERLDWEKLDRYATDFVRDIEDVDNVLVLYDVDVDGLFSGYFMENYLRTLGKNVIQDMNENKEHGLSDIQRVLNKIRENNVGLVVIPDAGTNDTEQLNMIKDLGVKTYVLDHHEIEVDLVEDEYIKILNVSEDSRLPKISGAGVTYRFIEKLNEVFNKPIEQYENLVGITVLSDVCDMTEPENRYYVQRLYETCESVPFFKCFDFYGSYSSLISFKVVPFLNALIRTGKTDLAMKIVNNMWKERVLRSIVKPHIYSVKEEQKNMVDELLTQGKVLKLDGLTVHIRKGLENREVNGLLANKLLGKYNQSCMVVGINPDDMSVKGSFRGLNVDYDILKRYGFECMGHPNACGISIDKEGFFNFKENFEVRQSELRDKTLKSIDVTCLVDDIKGSNIELRRIALFNEYTGNNVIPIRIKLNDFRFVTVEEINKPNFSEFYIEGVRVVDFNNIESDNMVVEPVYDVTRGGYQLIRVDC